MRGGEERQTRSEKPFRHCQTGNAARGELRTQLWEGGHHVPLIVRQVMGQPMAPFFLGVLGSVLIGEHLVARSWLSMTLCVAESTSHPVVQSRFSPDSARAPQSLFGLINPGPDDNGHHRRAVEEDGCDLSPLGRLAYRHQQAFFTW
jgi:hypothetical protein